MGRLYTEKVNIGYGERLIVKQLTINIPDQKITAIIRFRTAAENRRCSKAMTRIISHRSGAVVLDGKDIATERTKKLAQKMAILPQNPESARGLTVSRTRALRPVSLPKRVRALKIKRTVRPLTGPWT